MRNEEEYIWLHLFLGQLDPTEWYKVADLLSPEAPRLHFHVLTTHEAPETNRATWFCRDYDKEEIEKFESFISSEGGKTYITDVYGNPDYKGKLVARIMMLCDSRNEYIRIRKEIYQRFPTIQPRSGQLVGMICDEDGECSGFVSK